MKNIFYIFLTGFSSFTSALVLDWQGSYKLEEEFIQNVGEGEWDFHILHNLRLEPDIKVRDGLSVKSGFQLSSPIDFTDSDFYYQNGGYFGWNSAESKASLVSSSVQSLSAGASGLTPPPAASPVLPARASSRVPGLAVRHLYLQFAHPFGVFQAGWKPHHFGIGMRYNDGEAIFSPVYNKQGSLGFISWKGILGSYYVQPLVHYIDSIWFNLFIQGGWKTKLYGVEAIYKFNPLGVGEEGARWRARWPMYFGVYGYYRWRALFLEAEWGQSGDTQGGAFKLKWQTPWQKLYANLKVGFSTSSHTEQRFYFDPSFSATELSFMVERYEGIKNPRPEYLKKYLFYTFHDGFYIRPEMVFLWNRWELKAAFSFHPESWPDGRLVGVMPLYVTDWAFSYQLPSGVKWINRVGFLFPAEGDWYIGVNSGVAITF